MDKYSCALFRGTLQVEPLKCMSSGPKGCTKIEEKKRKKEEKRPVFLKEWFHGQSHYTNKSHE